MKVTLNQLIKLLQDLKLNFEEIGDNGVIFEGPNQTMFYLSLLSVSGNYVYLDLEKE